MTMFFIVKWVPGWGRAQRDSSKTVLYLLINIIILISFILYIFIKLLTKMRTIPAKTGNGTPQKWQYCDFIILQLKKNLKEDF